MKKLIDKKYLPENFKYPFEVIKLLELNLTNYDIWYFMESEYALDRMQGLKTRYKQRILIPFAMRRDNDDIACIDFTNNNKIVVIHDYASEGYEQKKAFVSTWEWLQYVISEMIEFEQIEAQFYEN